MKNHPLNIYLKKKGMTQAILLKAIHKKGTDVCQSHISQICLGIRRPSAPLAYLIERLTSGEVQASQLLLWEVPTRKDGSI